jgi:hypothetical protein
MANTYTHERLRFVPAGQRAPLKVAGAVVETENGKRVADVRNVFDAKLFAAAPQLLDALVAMEQRFGQRATHTLDEIAVDLARAAIAKVGTI